METYNTPDLALELIEENIKTKKTFLDLGNCGLTHLPEELRFCVWLEILTLGDGWSLYNFKTKQWERGKSKNKGQSNYIESISGLENLRKLSKLIISNSQIVRGSMPLSDLSPLLGLNSLLELNCSSTHVSDLAPLSKLASLLVLDCSSTYVSDLSPLSRLQSLKVVNCSSTQVSDLSPLSRLLSLNEFDCSRSHVSNLAPLSDLSELELLWFSGTQVSDLSPLISLSSLETIAFESTLISDLSPLLNMSSLIFLDCDSTDVSDLGPLAELHSLQEISCSGTNVFDLQPLSTLTSLRSLECNNSQVKKLKPISVIMTLKSFSARGCPIEDCPADVYQSNNAETLRAFFERDAEDEQIKAVSENQETSKNKQDTRQNDVKLILLGNSDAGKTSLLHYLKSGEFLTERDSTHGLEVHRWLPDAVRFPSLTDIAVSIWDFGGQEYYHDAYRLFMSANAAYLLLWDEATDCNGHRLTCLKSGDPEENLEHFQISYWLDTVRYYSGTSGRSPLMVVQNKTDKSGKHRLSQGLHSKYGIDESFHISLKNGCEASNPEYVRESRILRYFDAELERALLGMVDKVGLPQAWRQVRVSLLDLQEDKNLKKNPFVKKLQADGSLTFSDFSVACETLLKESLKATEVRSLVTTLERGGVLVYFKDSPILSERVFIKPAEFAERIYEILKTEVLDLRGEFTIEQVFGKRIKNNFRKTFIEATQNLGLVFPHPTREGAYIAPQYLPEDHPIEDLYKIASHGTWQSAYWIKVPLFYYKKVLNNLVLNYASDGSEARYFWKHGIFLLKDSLRVLVKGLYPSEEETEGILHIGVEQCQTRNHLVIQREIFTKILHLLIGEEHDASRAGNIVQEKHSKHHLVDKGVDWVTAIQGSLDEAYQWLEVSIDGQYFIKYGDLKKQAVSHEIRIEAQNIAGETQKVLIRKFEALLDQTPKHAKRVFVSYSHSNTVWLGRLRNHLSGLRRSNDIETWDDQEILPGEHWDQSIKNKLAEADVFILLLSSDFIASNYIWDVELKTAISKYQNESKLVIPVLIEPLDLGGLPGVNEEGTKIQDFEIIPKNKDERLQAISLWQNEDEALAKVAERIRQAIQSYKTNSKIDE